VEYYCCPPGYCRCSRIDGGSSICNNVYYYDDDDHQCVCDRKGNCVTELIQKWCVLCLRLRYSIKWVGSINYTICFFSNRNKEFQQLWCGSNTTFCTCLFSVKEQQLFLGVWATIEWCFTKTHCQKPDYVTNYQFQYILLNNKNI